MNVENKLFGKKQPGRLKETLKAHGLEAIADAIISKKRGSGEYQLEATVTLANGIHEVRICKK